VKEDPDLVANERIKRRFQCLEVNGRKRKKFLCLEANGRRRRRFLCLEANGRRRKRFLFTSSHFPPEQFYLDLRIFPLILKFYFTMVLGYYSCISLAYKL